ncbi:MAG: IclR family transcriptional regulator [Euzebyales bacterium]|nr:IclR family transcriptional regulator [Euzebyales bacterium]
MARTGQPATRHIAAVARAVTVLDVLAESDAALGTNEIARRAGINASSVSRLLATLTGAGLVEHLADTGRYRLGLRLFYLGNAALARVDLRALARPELRLLAEASGETSTLCVPAEDEALTVDFVQSARSVQSVARVGRPSVAHATAVGKVLLAHRGGEPSGPLTAFTGRTITDPAALADELARTVERGWAQAVGEREPDLNAVAVPVRQAGALVAILGLQGPSGRFGPRAMRKGVGLLQASATRIAGAGADR